MTYTLLPSAGSTESFDTSYSSSKEEMEVARTVQPYEGEPHASKEDFDDDNTRCHWLKERAVREYCAELKLSRHLQIQVYYIRLSPGLLPSFFSEQASRQIGTEEPNKGL